MSTPATKEIDYFVRIGAQRSEAVKRQLEVPHPPKLPAKFLPARASDPRAVFRPLPKLETARQLKQELARVRRKFRPFLANHAPALRPRREALALTHFDWRLEPATRWQRVTIPHYGGPIGRAVAHYRTTFRLPARMRRAGSLHVCFEGVDYQAHVFLNGRYLGSHEGFFAPFEFDLTAWAAAGENQLEVRVENDAICHGNHSWGQAQEGDKLYAATGLGWDDPELGWHHCPPGMGIWGRVTIEGRPALHLRDVFVRPRLEERRAEAWIEVFNPQTRDVPVELRLSVFGKNFPGTLFRNVRFAPAEPAGPGVNYYRFEFDVPRPRVWDLDSPWLYELQAELANGDGMAATFGMRSFRLDTRSRPRGRFYLNGREIRLRGANTMGFEQQDVLRGDFAQLRDDLLLAKIGGMNFLRLTQRPVQREVYEMCDRLGLLAQTDLPLFTFLRRNQFCEALRQAGEMERHVRRHPSNILVSYINEPFPYSWRACAHRHLVRAELERFIRAADEVVLLHNPDRVIKPIDGDYDAPGPGLPDNHCYTGWYNGHSVDMGKLHKGWWLPVKKGWNYACGEFGAEGLDAENVMRRFYPREWLPQSAAEEKDWSPSRIVRAQTGDMFYNFFDRQPTVRDWIAASQAHQAWVTRLMTEAFRRDNRMVSFAIHLFIDAWPAGWMKAIMDCLRQPKLAYFAYRDALAPLLPNIRTDRFAFFSGEEMRFELWVCNDTLERPAGAELRYQFEVNDRVIFAQRAPATVSPLRAEFQGFVKMSAPTVRERATGRLRLALVDAKGRGMNDTAVEVQLFPVPAPLKRSAAVVLGAERIARELGVQPARSADLLLIGDYAGYARQRKRIDAQVAAGATAVFLELPPGEYVIGGAPVKIERCGMNGRHFASRATGHPLVSGFAPRDFWFWHDPQTDCPSPLLDTVFEAAGWTPILTSGNGDWGVKWKPALAAAELRQGRGAFRVSQVKLAGRMNTNPVALLYARRLLGLEAPPPPA